MASSASSTAVARLEPFLLLAKSARGAGAAKLVAEATAAPGCYIFGELLEAEGVKEVSGMCFGEGGRGAQVLSGY